MDKTPKDSSMDRALEQFDSKFRFVLLASQRAEQLVRGAVPKVEARTPKHTRVAMEELKQGLVSWDYGPAPAEGAEGGEEGAEAATSDAAPAH